VRATCASFVVATVMLAACDPPATPAAEATARSEATVPAGALPDAVARTVRHLKDIAENGGYRELAQFASETPDFHSNGAGLSDREYWSLKERTGDYPAEQVGRVLAYPFTVVETPQGKVYIWPALATLKASEIKPAEARDIDRLLGEGQANELRKGAVWPGYVLGIREDGQWLYFVSGSG
jgi:hypothetical protein